MNKEEILANNIELLTQQAINKGNLDTCMIYGISGFCGKKCPKFEDKTCEEYLTTLENEYKSDELEIERLKDLCNKYEEEHKTTFEEWKKAINIINELEKWLDKKEKLTFNSWNKGIHEVQRKLQELKGRDKE